MKKRSVVILKFYLELLRIGLKVGSVLDKDFNTPVLKDLDWNDVYLLAQEQGTRYIEYLLCRNFREHGKIGDWLGT